MRQTPGKKMTKLLKTSFLLLAFTLLTVTAQAHAPMPANEKTSLDKYVEAPDPSY